MAYLHERVIAYVTMDPRLFVAEERSLQHGENPNKDLWWIDVQIADPWDKIFYLGEATYDPRPNRLMEKLHVFVEREVEILKRLGRAGDGVPKYWKVRPWLFIREAARDYVVKNIPQGLAPRITYLEETAFPWKYEKLRKLGQEPGRPYPELDVKYQS